MGAGENNIADNLRAIDALTSAGRQPSGRPAWSSKPIGTTRRRCRCCARSWARTCIHWPWTATQNAGVWNAGREI